jgi:chemotaxis protein MotB
VDKTRPIFIVKKQNGHGRHHGGAWKVAYADFVTAMMSLFIVLWLSASKPIQEAVGGYFRDPNGTASKKGSTLAGSGENLMLTKDNMPKLKDQLEQKIHEMIDFEKLKNHIEMTVTSEGLRIELMESALGTLFDIGSPKLNADGSEVLIALAEEIGKLPNKVSIEGHTDSKPYSTSGNYSNWEISTDRANAARRLMEANGLQPNQVSQVRGFADQRLRKMDDPLDPSNRRISLIVQYIFKNDEEDAKPSAADALKPGMNTSPLPAEPSGKKK